MDNSQYVNLVVDLIKYALELKSDEIGKIKQKYNINNFYLDINNLDSDYKISFNYEIVLAYTVNNSSGFLNLNVYIIPEMQNKKTIDKIFSLINLEEI